MEMIHITSIDIKEPLLLKSGETYTVVLDLKNSSSIYVLEFQDKLFRTNSAVVLPEMEKPADSTDVSKISPIAMIASCLQYSFNTSKTMLVTGHTDTAGNTEYNVKLSQKRARTVLATLTGDSDTFADICSRVEYRRNSDYNQILAWVSEKWNWDCHPGQINDNGNDLIVNKFRKEYNSKGPGSAWAPKITEWGGAGGNEIWTAYFNCYENFLVDELKTDRDGLKKLRDSCKFIIQRKWVGCGESHPRTAQNIDEFPCDTNRRVEVAFFDNGEKPVLTCENDPLQCSKNNCELYDPKKYPRVILPPVVSPVVTGVSWIDVNTPVKNGDYRKVEFQGGGLPDGTHVHFISVSYSSYDPKTGKTTDKTNGPARKDWFQKLPVGGRNIDVLSSSEFTGKKPVDNTKIPQYFRGPQTT
jgi:outer membrane protein OmpA-like peptidoglycan-associated protein